MNKKLLIKSLIIGIVIFLITQFVSVGYTKLIMKIVPSGTSRSLKTDVLLFSTKITTWVCRPGMKITVPLAKDKISSSQSLSKHRSLIYRIPDFIFWFLVSLIVLIIKNKKQPN